MFLEERELFLRERLAGAYRTSAYFWSRSLAETPLHVAFALLFGLIGYGMLGLQATPAHVATYALVLVLITLAAESHIVLVGAVARDDRTAALLAPLVSGLMSLLGGFFVNVDSLPPCLSWLQYVSLFRYGYAALMQNEFRGLAFTCSDADMAPWLDRMGNATRKHVEELRASGELVLPCPTIDGEAHLSRLKLDHLGLWTNVAALAVFIAVFRTLAFYGLAHRAHQLLRLQAYAGASTGDSAAAPQAPGPAAAAAAAACTSARKCA